MWFYVVIRQKISSVGAQIIIYFLRYYNGMNLYERIIILRHKNFLTQVQRIQRMTEQ